MLVFFLNGISVWYQINPSPFRRFTMLVVFVFILIIFITILAFGCYQWYLLNWGPLSNIPRPRAHFLFGNALQIERDNAKFWDQLLSWYRELEQHGILALWLAHEPILALTAPEHVEALLGSSELITKDKGYRYIGEWLGEGLLTSLPSKWKTRRKMITPSFHFNILLDFLVVFNEQAEILADLLETASSGRPVDIFPFITHCTLDIICETAMGKRIDAQHNSDSAYISSLYRVSQMTLNRSKAPWFELDWVYNWFGEGKKFRAELSILHRFTLDVIADRRRALGPAGASGQATAGQRRQAFLDMLLSATCDGRPLSDEDIREEVDTFMFEGHDTTAAAISWALYLLARHPAEQRRVQNELDAIFGSSQRSPSADDLRAMKYLECVIKEALRMFPSVPFFGRQLTSELRLGRFLLPKRTRVFVFPMALHRNPRLFAQPEVFRPERFLPENSQSRHPFAFVPFSAGPRNCIGQKFALMEEKVVLSTLLRRFDLSTPLRLHEVAPCVEIITRPGRPLLVSFNDREHVNEAGSYSSPVRNASDSE